jgi:hypothetical protein
VGGVGQNGSPNRDGKEDSRPNRCWPNRHHREFFAFGKEKGDEGPLREKLVCVLRPPRRRDAKRTGKSEVLRMDRIAPEAHPTLTSVIRVIEGRVAVIKGGWHGCGAGADLRGGAIGRGTGREGRRRRVIGGRRGRVGRGVGRGGESRGGVLVLGGRGRGALDELYDLEGAGLTDV